MRRVVVTGLVLALFLGVATPARAADSTDTLMALKALRGVENITLGFVTEWPKTIYYDSADHGIPYGVTVGTKPMLYPEFPHELREQPR